MEEGKAGVRSEFKLGGSPPVEQRVSIRNYDCEARRVIDIARATNRDKSNTSQLSCAVRGASSETIPT